jgi:type IV pilus biogenesis protein CpaD/CtpE
MREMSKLTTKQEQLVDELLVVLSRLWEGRKGHFEQFSASYLTRKGEAIALAIPKGDMDRDAARRAVSAGY